ncbi:hypothetical protein Huta_1557 [Halorhabdus utahensis DSM 12940]|uniref:Uncharacterized protein n=1 Tax=Halorhabdus utahensis (strain DSM 12940 / JCM 11049 / AX-2) TaxID=519442 RepID=C7NPE5_HALUD|nr:hypothetical protein [Halorhabdus utahensis]ACV11732.1 hypothetical protein Huta_1557 [Halorhabdus utahensis DSM 12940]
MGLVQLLIDFVLGPISLFDVIMNLEYLGQELGYLVESITAGQIIPVLRAFVMGNLLLSKAVAGFFGTLLWLGILSS